MRVVEQVAECLIRSWRTGERQSHQGLVLSNEAQAYAVQHHVAQALGWFADGPARAWKLGGAPSTFISAAGVPSAAIHLSGWQASPDCCYAFGIECELLVRLGCDLDEHTDLATAYSAVDAWLPGIELCDSRWLHAEQASALLCLADQQLNRALIMGPPSVLECQPDWSKQTAEVRVNGVQQVRKTGSHPFTQPLNSLPWLARHAKAQGNPLRAGDIVATGSWTGIYWAPAGARVDVEFANFGQVTLHT
ncbi:fumarylacetoacetate hydrolase family protein [Pseudomonas sp.]|uniref:fumarylacetoacetate hydrolase family protein n=1 Tax=Pseudomonas sp. TaxID=306 RepID=UPI002731B636|nr:fumarylacetoacetate hydrolase family protein [Pseudomonas sp.]MDP2242374.1 fumarylacetoacetate hydrolase family protein [Pseudomonas sp.]